MRNILIWLLIAVSGSVPAAAQTAEECAAIAADPDRLACYDALFRDAAPVEPGAALVAESERMIPARPSGRGFAMMTVSCVAGGIDVAFGFAGHLVSNTGDIAPVTFQIDQNATAVRTLSADADNTLLRFATAREAGAFLDSLAGGRNLKVRMTPVRQRSLTVDFRLTDIAEPLEALRASCG